MLETHLYGSISIKWPVAKDEVRKKAPEGQGGGGISVSPSTLFVCSLAQEHDPRCRPDLGAWLQRLSCILNGSFLCLASPGFSLSLPPGLPSPLPVPHHPLRWLLIHSSLSVLAVGLHPPCLHLLMLLPVAHHPLMWLLVHSSLPVLAVGLHPPCLHLLMLLPVAHHPLMWLLVHSSLPVLAVGLHPPCLNLLTLRPVAHHPLMWLFVHLPLIQAVSLHPTRLTLLMLLPVSVQPRMWLLMRLPIQLPAVDLHHPCMKLLVVLPLPKWVQARESISF